MVKKILFIILNALFKYISKNTSKKAFLLNKIIIDANHSIGRGSGGPNSVKNEIKSIKNYLDHKEELLIIDGGAHKGTYTDEIRTNFPNAYIHCFEPSKVNFDLLIDKYKENKNIEVINCGLSDEDTSSFLFSDSEGSGLASVNNRRLSHFDKEFKFKEEIKLIKFEDYWKKEISKKNIDLLKLDIEGNELNALKGCGKAVNNIKIVQFEFGGANIDSKTYFQDFWYFFKEKNFTLKRITPFGEIEIDSYTEEEEYFLTTNYLAFNNESL
tara:strand:+ start:1846 stop:2655 length:810 start_codon:yes stop_codon:yes gene_type:complete